MRLVSFLIRENVDVEERKYRENNCKIYLIIIIIMVVIDIIVDIYGKKGKLNKSYKICMILKMRKE